MMMSITRVYVKIDEDAHRGGVKVIRRMVREEYAIQGITILCE